MKLAPVRQQACGSLYLSSGPDAYQDPPSICFVHYPAPRDGFSSWKSFYWQEIKQYVLNQTITCLIYKRNMLSILTPEV